MSNRLTNHFNEIIELKNQSIFFIQPIRGKIFLILGFIFILAWQYFFYVNRDSFSSEYGRKDASGFSHHYAQHFIYFYYYLDIFPVTTSFRPLEFSKEGAQKSILEHGDSLLMEKGHWSRLGESTRILLYLPNAYVKGSAENPTIVPFNAAILTIALLAIFYSFYLIGMPFLGFFISLIFGSNPFLLYETYKNENIFALMICVTLIILALNLRFFLKKPINKFSWLIPVISGIIVGTAVTIRSESSVVLVSCLFIYITVQNLGWLKKASLCLLVLISFLSTKLLWQHYFEIKFKEATEIVTDMGGNPYTGNRIVSHTFWHPVYCGLADFDTKYGYNWDDEREAYKYALPILREKYKMDLAYNDQLGLDEYYDKQKKYYKKIELFPEYEEIMREKVLRNIQSDPIWYLKIIASRIAFVFTKTSPVWISFKTDHLSIPFNGLFVIPILILLVVRKKWFQLKILVFSFPLAATSILIFAKKNITYNSCFHLFAVAFLLAWIADMIISLNKPKVPMF